MFCINNYILTFFIPVHLFVVVLNERQRKAKRKLIEENRERRKQDHVKGLRLDTADTAPEHMSDRDRSLIADICAAYEATRIKAPNVRFPMVSQLSHHV